MPHHILIEEEIQVNRERRKYTKDYIQLCLRTNKCEPKDAEMEGQMDFQGRSDVVEHVWMDAKVAGTCF